MFQTMNLSQYTRSSCNLSHDVTHDVATTPDQSSYSSHYLLSFRDLADLLALCFIFVVCLSNYSRVFKKFSWEIKVMKDIGCGTDDTFVNGCSCQPAQFARCILPSDLKAARKLSVPCYNDRNNEIPGLRTIATSRCLVDRSSQYVDVERDSKHCAAGKYSTSNSIKSRTHFLKKSRIPVLLALRKRKKRGIIDNEIISGDGSNFNHPHSELTVKPIRKRCPSTPEYLRIRDLTTHDSHRSLDRSSPANMTYSPRFSDRYRYCDSLIRHGVLLRSPERELVGESMIPTPTTERASHTDGSKSFLQQQQQGTEKDQNSRFRYGRSSLDSFVFKPRLRYGTNRKLYRVSYNCS